MYISIPGYLCPEKGNILFKCKYSPVHKASSAVGLHWKGVSFSLLFRLRTHLFHYDQ
jgi:hypothetical protein